jgi:amino acid transporter
VKTENSSLVRRLTFPTLTLYGLGTVVGAGIYAIIGEVAAAAGIYTPLAFLAAALLAVFSALSLAELSARLPHSAGEAVFVKKAFGSMTLSTAVGMLVILSGVVSAATIINGAVGYVQAIFSADLLAIVVGLTALLAFAAALGVHLSVGAAALVSVIEILGLLAVIWAGRGAFGNLPEVFSTAPPLGGSGVTLGILSGAVIAFYSFIGFEDMVNMAEEVKNPGQVMPRAMMTVFFGSTALYVLLSLVIIGSMDPLALRSSGAPLADVFSKTTGWTGDPIAAIGIIAIVNGGLVQIIMGSRVVYGLAKQGALPKLLGHVDRRTHTPVAATLLIAGSVLALALVGSIKDLAEITSMLLLLVFTMINAALVRIKLRDPQPEDVPNYPILVPILGAIVSLAMVVWRSMVYIG